MPKRSNEFQHLVTLIERLLADPDARVTESKELIDRVTGELREVDIVIEWSDGVRDIVIGVECTATSRPASVEWVERMWGKHSSLPTDKLVLVSRSGFWRIYKVSRNYITTDRPISLKYCAWSCSHKRPAFQVHGYNASTDGS